MVKCEYYLDDFRLQWVGPVPGARQWLNGYENKCNVISLHLSVFKHSAIERRVFGDNVLILQDRVGYKVGLRDVVAKNKIHKPAGDRIPAVQTIDSHYTE
jgi:hypothetical protein